VAPLKAQISTDSMDPANCREIKFEQSSTVSASDSLLLDDLSSHLAHEFTPTFLESRCFWKVQDVLKWLEVLELPQHIRSFQAASIDGSMLEELTDADLKDLGVNSKFHRRKILQRVNEFLDSNRSASDGMPVLSSRPSTDEDELASETKRPRLDTPSGVLLEFPCEIKHKPLVPASEKDTEPQTLSSSVHPTLQSIPPTSTMPPAGQQLLLTKAEKDRSSEAIFRNWPSMEVPPMGNIPDKAITSRSHPSPAVREDAPSQQQNMLQMMQMALMMSPPQPGKQVPPEYTTSSNQSLFQQQLSGQAHTAMHNVVLDEEVLKAWMMMTAGQGGTKPPPVPFQSNGVAKQPQKKRAKRAKALKNAPGVYRDWHHGLKHETSSNGEKQSETSCQEPMVAPNSFRHRPVPPPVDAQCGGSMFVMEGDAPGQHAFTEIDETSTGFSISQFDPSTIDYTHKHDMGIQTSPHSSRCSVKGGFHVFQM